VPSNVPVYTWNLAGYQQGHGPFGTGLRHTFGANPASVRPWPACSKPDATATGRSDRWSHHPCDSGVAGVSQSSPAGPTASSLGRDAMCSARSAMAQARVEALRFIDDRRLCLTTDFCFELNHLTV
jgi:hypothetical protein